MARKPSPPTEPAFKNPLNGQAGIPTELNTQLDNQASQYSDAYAHHNFGTAHPYLTALAGLALMGPAGLTLPMSAQNADATHHANLAKSYHEAYSKAIENQANTDKIAAPRNEAAYVNNGINTEINAGRINPNTQTLSPNAAYSTDFIKHAHTGAMNPASLGLVDNIINNQQQQSYGVPNQTSFGQQGQHNQNLPHLDMGQPTLNAGAQQYYKPLNSAYDPTQLPTFMSDATFGNVQQAQSTAASNGLSQGNERYKFDQEAPKRQAEALKALQEGNAAGALAILRGAQTMTEKQRPGLIRSEVNKNNASASYDNRRYSGGPAAPNPTSASELHNMYQQGGFGPPGSKEAIQAYTSALQNDPTGYSTQTQNTLDDKGHVLSSTSRRVQNQRGVNPQFQSSPSQAPTVIKGAHGTYSF